MKFNFISICTYLCGVYPMYCSCLTTSDPISLGTTLCLIFVLGTMEIHWKLVLFIMKVVWSSYNWRQAMMIGKLISTSSLQCYLGNKYLSHAYSYIIQPCVGCILAWNSFICKCCAYCNGLKENSLLQMWVYWDECIYWGLYKIMFMIHQIPIMPS